MNNILMISHQKKNQKGVTFLEVLIAMVILVTGILGAVAMQATAKQSSFDAMQRSLASSLAQDIVERMRNNSNNIGLYEVGSPFGDGDVKAQKCSRVNSNCAPAQIRQNDLFEWEQALIGSGTKNIALGKDVGGLIGGTGCIDVTGNRVTIVVSWQGRTNISDGAKASTGVACGTTGKKSRQVVVNAFIL